ncbi:hydantoinase/oxoprolinase family protein, partial [Pseudomonas sp. TH31]|uniref:hydantoinase/oxoprolinase family protein n=1 Tax=Pseudomonas sp. TH31 TaxID=2796396 RepID=UPI00191137C0
MTLSSSDVLHINDLHAGYGLLEILHGVDLTVRQGEFVTLLGPNGAGKSTLLKSLFGMTTYRGGSIRWRGHEMCGRKPKSFLAEGIAYVPQGRCNFPLMTVDENLDLAGAVFQDADSKADRQYVFDLFPVLYQRRHQNAGNLSGGEQQLLEMAMAVLRRPKILLVDEPSVGLSPQAITLVFDELKRLHAGGRTILLVEQNTRKAMESAERAVVLRLGKVIWDSPVAELSHAHLGELFMTGLPDRQASPICLSPPFDAQPTNSRTRLTRREPRGNPSMKLAFDTGGTFTDFAMTTEDGSIHLHKVLSTPDDPARAVLQGINELLARVQRPENEGLQILGATTVVTNAVLERKGVDTALLATDGFQDLLRIRTEGRYDLYDLNIQYPEPLVPRQDCKGVRERIAADGSVILSLDEAQVRQLAGELQAAGIQSVAVCLLHAYKYPAHERRIGELLNDVAPGLSVSLSSAVCPEVREFDRASTTVANAYTRPLMQRHVEHLERELAKLGVQGQLMWMTSSGGVVPSVTAAQVPVRLIESGPAAGAVAAADYARAVGESSVLSFDMGGTTAKLCLLPNGEPLIANELEVARFERFRKGSGFPLKIQSIHMIEIGAGGGSIASRSSLGLLAVGPRSAGAAPGPACYGRGGREPTVTDADLLLGYLDERS